MTTATDPNQTAISPEEVATIEALMAEMNIEHDQAEAAYREVRAELDAEPIPTIATNEAEAFLARYLRRRQLIDSELTRVKDQMKAMIRGLEAKLATIDFVCRTQAIEHTKKLISGKKTKSVKLPHGTAGFRTTPPSVEFIDGQGQALLEWCRKNCPEAIKQPPPEILKTPLADILKMVEQVPGAKLKPATEKFYVQ